MVDELPEHARDDLGEDIGQEEKSPEEHGSLEPAVAHDGREGQRERKLDRERHYRDDEVVPESLVDDGVFEKLRVVGEPVEVDHGAKAVPFIETEYRGLEDGDDDQGREEYQRRA